jgi:hypothetical protein
VPAPFVAVTVVTAVAGVASAHAWEQKAVLWRSTYFDVISLPQVGAAHTKHRGWYCLPHASVRWPMIAEPHAAH